MSYKISQLSPRLSTRTIRMRIIPLEFCLPSGAPRQVNREILAKSFVQAWFEDDSRPAAAPHANWGAISGMALSLVLSAGFWTALAMAVGKIWK